MRKVKLHNLRVHGNRIPQDVWNRIAETLLPGPAPTAADVKHGKSKSAVLKRIVATDKAMRAAAVKLAGEYMSSDALKDARNAGWAPTATATPDKSPRLDNGEIDYVTLVAELRAHTEPKPPAMLCGTCRSAATRQSQDPAGRMGHYCDRHDWLGAMTL